MSRLYVACHACKHSRMRLIGKSSETFGDPPGETERYYHCPNCGDEWTFDLEHNVLRPGVPPDFTQYGQ